MQSVGHLLLEYLDVIFGEGMQDPADVVIAEDCERHGCVWLVYLFSCLDLRSSTKARCNDAGGSASVAVSVDSQV